MIMIHRTKTVSQHLSVSQPKVWKDVGMLDSCISEHLLPFYLKSHGLYSGCADKRSKDDISIEVRKSIAHCTWGYQAFDQFF